MITGDLTWQHQLLVGILISGGVIGSYWITRGYLQRTWKYSVMVLVWNAVEATLLITGAEHSAWQYYVYAGYLLLDTMVAVPAGLVGKRTDFEGNGPEGVQIFFVFLAVFLMASLIVTGA